MSLPVSINPYLKFLETYLPEEKTQFRLFFAVDVQQKVSEIWRFTKAIISSCWKYLI